MYLRDSPQLLSVVAPLIKAGSYYNGHLWMNRPLSPHAHWPWLAPIWKCSLAIPMSFIA